MIDVRPREYRRIQAPYQDGSWGGIKPPACHVAGCVYGAHRQDGRIFFVHDSPSRFSMLEIDEAQLSNIDFDFWGEVGRPWVERLHAEDGA